MTKEISYTLSDGRTVRATAVGGKVYANCPVCRKTVQLNKPVLGNLHFCEDRP